MDILSCLVYFLIKPATSIRSDFQASSVSHPSLADASPAPDAFPFPSHLHLSSPPATMSSPSTAAAAVSRIDILRLYRALLTAGRGFADYNFRAHARRRVVETFREERYVSGWSWGQTGKRGRCGNFLCASSCACVCLPAALWCERSGGAAALAGDTTAAAWALAAPCCSGACTMLRRGPLARPLTVLRASPTGWLSMGGFGCRRRVCPRLSPCAPFAVQGPELGGRGVRVWGQPAGRGPPAGNHQPHVRGGAAGH